MIIKILIFTGLIIGGYLLGNISFEGFYLN